MKSFFGVDKKVVFGFFLQKIIFLKKVLFGLNYIFALTAKKYLFSQQKKKTRVLFSVIVLIVVVLFVLNAATQKFYVANFKIHCCQT